MVMRKFIIFDAHNTNSSKKKHGILCIHICICGLSRDILIKRKWCPRMANPFRSLIMKYPKNSIN